MRDMNRLKPSLLFSVYCLLFGSLFPKYRPFSLHYENELRIRYRVNGSLFNLKTITVQTKAQIEIVDELFSVDKDIKKTKPCFITLSQISLHY